MIGSKTARAIAVAACLVLAPAVWASSAQAQPGGGAAAASNTQDYHIAPGDGLQVFVWRNPDLTVTVAVRPDGKISIPLVEDITCVGKTPTELAREIEARLAKYVTNPVVTVMVTAFAGSYDQEVRIVGEAVTPKAIPYKNHMTVLDAMIEVGGLTHFAAGNDATLVRSANGTETVSRLSLGNLLKNGDVKANVPLMPGDVIIIPQSYF
jgi:polysaccharide export outer membrane protein